MLRRQKHALSQSPTRFACTLAKQKEVQSMELQEVHSGDPKWAFWDDFAWHMSLREWPGLVCCRAALKETNLRRQTQICGFLWVPAIFRKFLRKCAVFCGNRHFPKRESANGA